MDRAELQDGTAKKQDREGDVIQLQQNPRA